MTAERTLVLLKPDAVQRGLTGKILTRFEDVGLKIIGMKMLWADDSLAKKHYQLDEAWAKNVYEKNKAVAEKEGRKVAYRNHMELGEAIQSWNMTFLKEGPVMAMVLQGPHAIEVVRKMVGHTEPKQALPGTIRGDFASLESYSLSDKKKRVTRNLVHASDTKENAEREIALWFSSSELHNYTKELDRHF